MSLNPGVRKAAFAAAFVGASLPFMFSAAAEEAKGSPACAGLAERTDTNPSAKNFRAEAKCELDQVDARIKGYNKQAKDAGQRANEYAKDATRNREIADCYGFLTRGITGGTLNKPDIFAQGGGAINDGNVCVVAKHFGYGRGAATKAPIPN